MNGVATTEILWNYQPEGLTTKQQRLIDTLFRTEITAPIGKVRFPPPNNKPEYYKVNRRTAPIAFAQSIDDEFALVGHREEIKRGEELSPLSPIYINLRGLPPEVYDEIGLVLSEIELSTEPDFCIGIPNAGIPIAEAFSEHSGIPIALDFLQKEEERIIMREGVEGRGEKVLLIDDVVTHADTKLHAARAMEERGFKVMGFAVACDREQGAREQLESLGYGLYAATRISQILRYGLRMGKGGLNRERYESTRNYLGLAA
jgi:orotate phosphoribosyltransferase